MIVKTLGKLAGWGCHKVVGVGVNTLIALVIRKLLLKK